MAYWSDLPPELLDLLAAGLDTPSESRHFRSVCSTWRSAVPRSFPTFFHPIKFLNDNVHHCDLRLTKHTFFYLSTSIDQNAPGWLIKGEEHHLGALHLFSPFSRTLIKQLAPNLPRKLDLTKVNIRELDYEYVLRNVSDEANNMDLYNMEHEKVAVTFPYKTIIQYSPTEVGSDGGINGNYNEYVILSTHNTGKLLMYRSKIGAWTFLDDYTLGYDDRSIFVNDWSLHYVDVVEFNGTFYAVTNSGRTVAINVFDSSIKVTLLKKAIIGGDKKCLVRLADDLIMVDLYTDTTPKLIKVHGVEVFKLNKEEQEWELVKSLENYSIFLSNHSSFSALGLKGCKGNCIYFHFKNLENKDLCCFESKEGDINELDGFSWRSDEVGVFDFEKGFFGPLKNI